MNAPLASPALHPAGPHVAVIGAGPGGLAAALLLAARGVKVSLFEKDSVPGGRTRTLTTPEGYRFDLGPTFFLYPRILAEIMAACGRRLEDEVELIRLDPQYRLVFEGDGAVLDATPDIARMEAEIARLCPGDAAGFRPFLESNRAKLRAFTPVLERGFGSHSAIFGADMVRALKLLRPHLSVDQDLARHFRDPRVRLAFSFQTKYLGMSPFRCPSLFTILSFLEYEHGVFHPRGGCGAVSEAMARVAGEMGVNIRYDTPVDRVDVVDGRTTGVTVAGRHIAADAVVVNADFAHAMPKLLPGTTRKRWTDKRIAAARYSCSTFMLYLGIEGVFPDLAHHTILLAEDYKRNIAEVDGGILPEIPSVYVQNACVTDPSMAPPGHSTLYVLVPVPNLRHGADWAAEAARYRELALDRLSVLGLGDIRARIRSEKMVTPQDWQDDYAVGYGATFNLTHDLMQMLSFRPRNRFAEVGGVYLVGGGTHPGSGLPVIYEGARITSKLVLDDLGVAAGPLASAVMTDRSILAAG
ncbi:phytoene desaturase [Humitalea rosea]|uniref:Phytoene desaturase n=1 Tax=Humitalea rosea TaxID=990373 RepID=A0A2W7IIQ8_9PROT|nr:phytoene desaturase family protein [Humitalea rosea]PZW46533.1 phytoene desaturase [Humitalea rosea]